MTPPIRTEAGRDLRHWLLTRHNALSLAIDENTNDARRILERQLRDLDRFSDEVLSRLPAIEAEAVTLALPGTTFPEAERLLEGGAVDPAA